MNCPKCDAHQPDDAEECSSCGIIFARWRASVERPLPPAAFHDSAAGATTTIPIVPIIAVVLVVLVGLGWTMKRRSARATTSPGAALDAQLNEINNAGLKDRQRLEEESARARRAAYQKEASSLAASVVTFPEGLSSAQARSMIESCSAFQEQTTLTLPKTFSAHLYRFTLDRYPALFPAARDLLVEFQPPLPSIYTSGRSSPPNFAAHSETINVSLTSMGQLKMRTNDLGDEIEIVLGPRQVVSVDSSQSSVHTAGVAFKWSYGDDVADTFQPPESEQRGSANFAKHGRNWQITQVSMWKDARYTTVCSW
ncbi:MAG TPA: hypothetical protein VMT00_00060 [Thermoanaerobaculia bacterium]|nr:hypothetical protein [Thermoanaerobaculia bacterium]